MKEKENVQKLCNSCDGKKTQRVVSLVYLNFLAYSFKNNKTLNLVLTYFFVDITVCQRMRHWVTQTCRQDMTTAQLVTSAQRVQDLIGCHAQLVLTVTKKIFTRYGDVKCYFD